MSVTAAGIEPATFRFVAQHRNHCATAVPQSGVKVRVHNGKTCKFIDLRSGKCSKKIRSNV